MRFLSISVLFIIASIYTSPTSAIIDKCYPKQSDFANACTTELKGVVDGGRCFFHIKSNTTWNQSGAACAQSGAQLAQIHSESEFNKIVVYLKNLGVISWDSAKYAHIAMYDSTQRSAGMLSSNCTMNPNSTKWYDTATSPNPLLTAGNTWIRYHNCSIDTYTHDPPRCFVMFAHQTTSVIDLGDWKCNESAAGALCQYNNQAQNFNATPYCLTETPIATAPAPAIATHPDDCARECGRLGWCRGFNYVFKGSSFICQLFPWSVYDTCPKCASRVPTNSTCTYFNYLP